MSADQVQVVCAAFDAFNRGDIDATLENAAPNFDGTTRAPLGADNRAVFSRSEALKYFREASALWESARLEIDELIEIGDNLVVPHTAHLRGRDGIEVQARTTWVITVREGQIERICLYQEKREALEAVAAQLPSET